MKKTVLKSVLCFVLIMVSIVFCGCSQVNFINYTDENGIYTEVLEITLDETKFENLNKAKQDISDAVNSTLLSKYSTYTMNINMKLNEFKYDSEKQDLYVAYQDLLDDVTWETHNFDDKNYFYIKLMFASTSSYLIFYDITEKNFSEKEVTKGLFYNTINYKGNLGYYIQHSLYSTLRHSPYLDKYFETFSEEDVDLTYSYLAGSSRYKSNADEVFYVGEGLYSHTWKVDTNNMDKEIHFSLRIANRWIWYVLAIGISLIVCVILILTALIMHFLKKKQQKNPMNS